MRLLLSLLLYLPVVICASVSTLTKRDETCTRDDDIPLCCAFYFDPVASTPGYVKDFRDRLAATYPIVNEFVDNGKIIKAFGANCWDLTTSAGMRCAERYNQGIHKACCLDTIYAKFPVDKIDVAYNCTRDMAEE